MIPLEELTKTLLKNPFWAYSAKKCKLISVSDSCINGVGIDVRKVKFWFKNGKLHREDGPAIENARGYKEWYIDGNRHREDGPAVEFADGTKLWYKNGKRQENK